MLTDFNANLVKNLPDSYKKTVDSNNFKILEIERITCNDLRKHLWGFYSCEKCGDTIPFGEQICPICGAKGVKVNSGVYDILDINNATGKTLDMYGKRVGQARGLADDEKYLLMIKAKIMRNLSNGSYPSIINALCMTFDCEPSKVLLVDGDEPCTVMVEILPLEVINKAGLTTSQTVSIIKSLLPIGVKLQTFLFEGTFELATSYEDMKVDGNIKGLTDTYENMKNPDAIGGYLGVTAGDEADTTLPI